MDKDEKKGGEEKRRATRKFRHSQKREREQY